MAASIALIPARGGSKRIPGKNIREFRGKPMIAYSIAAALEAAVFDRVIVSTDSAAIAEVAEQYGAEVPFRRPAELADDHSTTASVIRHFLEWGDEAGVPVERLCCLYATAPFATAGHIRKGLEILVEHKVSSVFTVASHPASPFRALQLDEQGALRMVWPEYELTRTNDLPETYYDAGQFYWLDAGRFTASGRIYSDDARPLVLPRYLVQDIDTIEDWQMAELLHEILQRKGMLS